MRACVHQPAAGGHVEAARCGKSTPEATRRGSKRAAATREGGCVHTRPRPGPLFTTRPRLAVRTELPLCALAPRSPTHQWDLTRSNFGPVRVGPVASELGRASVPQGGFQAPVNSEAWATVEQSIKKGTDRREGSPRISQFCFTQIKKSTIEILFIPFAGNGWMKKLYVKKRSKRKSSLNQTSSGRD